MPQPHAEQHHDDQPGHTGHQPHESAQGHGHPHHHSHHHSHHHQQHEQGQTPPRKKGVGKWILLGAVVVIVLIFVFSHKPQKKGAPANPTTPVAAAQVKQGNIDVTLDALGTVTPTYTVTVTSRVTGELQEIYYKEGQLVKKGDKLALIDPRPYEDAVTQAEGQLARDQATLKNAKLDLTRYQNAYQQHAIPQQQVATQQATVEQDQGVIRIDEGNLSSAQLNLTYAHITAPIDGRVGLRMVDPGNLVPANGTSGLATITQLQPITVVFTLAEDEIGPVAAELAAGHTLRVDALDRALERVLASGTLLTLDNQINTATGTLRGRATFANTHNELFPNQFVNARLYVKTLKGVNIIPTAAIQRNGDTTTVYVIKPQDSTVESRPIKVTTTEGDNSAVTGVNAGETVVTDGFDKLQNGSKVAVRQPGGQKGQQPQQQRGAKPQ